MIAIISYLEKEEYDLEIHKVLNDAFRVKDHCYLSPAFTIHKAMSRLGSGYEYVNVQRPITFKNLGYESFRLQDYVHPKDCCYVFGSNYGKVELIRGSNVSIDIGRGSLHTVSAMAMVLYDREIKCRASNSV